MTLAARPRSAQVGRPFHVQPADPLNTGETMPCVLEHDEFDTPGN